MTPRLSLPVKKNMAHRKNLAQEMFEHLPRQCASGMTAANYAKQAGITHFRLQYWIRKFKSQEAGKVPIKTTYFNLPAD